MSRTFPFDTSRSQMHSRKLFLRVAFISMGFFFLVGQFVCAANWKVVPFHPPDGLTFEDVRDICSTPDGSVWFSSWGSGVARLQGSEWRVFTKADGLPSDFAPSITPGSADDVWVATPAGVAHIVGETVVTYTAHNVPILTGHPSVAQRMNDGQIWIGDKDGRIVSCRLSPSKSDGALKQFEWSLIKEAAASPETNLLTICESADGRIWLAQGLGGLLCHEDDIWKAVPTDYRRVNDVVEDRQGRLWIVGSEGTAFWDGDAWRHQGSHAKCLAVSSEGRLFIGGVNRIAGLRNGEFTPFELRSAMGRRAIRVIEFTANSGAWIGTKRGIMQFVQPPWKDVSHTQESASFEGHAFGANPGQMPLGVNASDWLVRFDGEKNEWENLLKVPMDGDSRQYLSMPIDGRLWILNSDIALEVQLDPPAVLRQVELPASLRGSRETPTRLLATSENEIYTYGHGGAFRLEHAGWVRCAPEAALEPIVSMRALKPGCLLVGLRNRVERWCDDRTESSWQPPDVPHFHALTFANETSDGRIILGSRGLGLYIMRGAEVTQLTVRDGLPSARIVCFLEASDGTFWFGAQHSGILSLRDGRWIHYSNADGLPSSELLTLGEHPAGTIWAAYKNRAVLRYRPDKGPPETIISAATTEITSGGKGVFSVRGFDVLNHTPHKELLYSWRLTRTKSEEYVPWSAFAPQVTFTSIPLNAGVYRLQVRSQDRDRNIDPTPAEIQVMALAPVWQRAEFIAPLFFLLCVAGLMGIKAYRSHQEVRTHRDNLDELVKERTSQLVVANWIAEAERERLAATFNSIGDSVFATDDNGRILLMNPIAERLVGRSEREACGKRFDEIVQLLDVDSRQVIKGPVAELLNQHETIPAQMLIALCADSQGDRVLAINYSLIKDHAKATIGAVVVARDITEKRKLERERVKTSQLESLGVLAGGIAHDFNNLLVGILANVSSSRELHDLDEIRQRLRDAEKACLLARRLTSQLLTFSKGGAPVRQSVGISTVIRDSAESSLHGVNVSLQFDFDADLWPVDADVEQIRQVVNNLMVNACHSMPDGGNITISVKNVENGTSQSLPGLDGDRFVCVSIADQGIGIEPERLAGIFDPYYTTKAKSSGLGLAVCYSIVQQHNGLIQVQSKLGKGSRFDFYLPASSEPSWSDEIDEEDQGSSLAPKNILVMDDQPVVLESFQALLDSAGHHTFTACDSVEAVQVFSQAKEEGSPIDVVILDLTIPGGMGGKEVLQELLLLDPLVKSIVTSGYCDDPVMANYRDYGFHGRIPKPFPSRDLSRELQRVMELSAPRIPVERT